MPALVYSCPKRGAIMIALIIVLGAGNNDMPVPNAL
jgi:hypothetical protein